MQVQPEGLANWYFRIIEDPDSAHEILDKACDAGLKMLRQLDQAVGKYVDVVCIAHDFGDMRGVMIGAEKWREIYKPHYAKLFGEWRKITRMKSNLHSCGAISEIIGDLVECGLDILNPVQLSAAGMNAADLKQKYGDSLVFYGGSFDAVSTPASCSAEEVYELTKQNIREMAKNGGYLFSGVHNITGDVPEEHLAAVLRAYHDCREYERW